MLILHAFRRVFSFYRILYGSLHFLLGVIFQLESSLLFLFLSLSFILLFIREKFSFAFYGIIFFTLGFTLTFFHLSPFPFDGKKEGEGLIVIEKIERSSHPILPLWTIKGIVSNLKVDNTLIKGKYPFYATTKGKPSLKIGYAYQGKLEIEKRSSFSTKISLIPSNLSEKGIKNQWLVWRVSQKQKIKKWICHHFKKRHVQTLLTGLATGQLEDPLLSFYFQKLGLQHLLAISGFHFGIVALFFHFFMGRFFDPRFTGFLLLILLFGYFIYLGVAPSILRAFIASSMGAISQTLKARPKSCDILAFSLLIDLTLFPLDVYSLGFSLSYAATFGILTLYQPLLTSLQKLISLPSFILSLFALYFSASFLTLPILLYTFHSIPLLSALYNLFIPFAITAIMMTFIVWLPLSFIPILGSSLAKLLELFTEGVIKILFLYPRSWDLYLYSPPLPKEVFILLFTFSCGIAIFLLEKTLHLDKIAPSYGESSSVG